MDEIVKTFEELTREELYAVLRLRNAVFVVEQKCPYQDLDGLDIYAIHVFLRDCDGIKAYLRILPAGSLASEPVIGRVIAVDRRRGQGSRVLALGIRTARELLGAASVRVEAQSYAVPFYQKNGFVPISGEYLLDGIPHITMRQILDPESKAKK